MFSEFEPTNEEEKTEVESVWRDSPSGGTIGGNSDSDLLFFDGLFNDFDDEAFLAEAGAASFNPATYASSMAHAFDEKIEGFGEDISLNFSTRASY